jgi:ABC-type amino acid transport substrate-binding protein
MVYSKERDEKYSLETSMRTRGNVLVTNKKMKNINSLEDLTGFKVASATGYVISKEFTEATNFTKVEFTSSDETSYKILEKIINGTVDCGFLDIHIAKKAIHFLKLENKVIVTNFTMKKTTHVGFTKNNPYLKSYEKGFKIISENGKIKKIIDKYLPQ